jgi:hypothetical protein
MHFMLNTFFTRESKGAAYDDGVRCLANIIARNGLHLRHWQTRQVSLMLPAEASACEICQGIRIVVWPRL